MNRKIQKLKAGYVYIFENEAIPDLIKIGEATDVKVRESDLSGFAGVPGKYEAVWKHKVDHNTQAVEAALHYKFREYHFDKEFFKINKKIAIRIADELVRYLRPLKNPKAKQLKTLKSKDGSQSKMLKASKSLWSDVIKSEAPDFVKETVRLCLKEKRAGQPQYRRFSAIRNSGHTTIGRADLYIMKEHLRIVISNKSYKHCKDVIKNKIGSGVEVTKWEGGASFFITNEKEFKAFRKWFNLGTRPAPTYVI